jgi:hypothetical protein
MLPYPLDSECAQCPGIAAQSGSELEEGGRWLVISGILAAQRSARED